MPARLRCRGFLRLADEVSTDLVHGSPANPSRADIGSASPQARPPAVILAAYPFRLFVSADRRARRAGRAFWRSRDRDLWHDGSRDPDCCEPSGATEARIRWQA